MVKSLKTGGRAFVILPDGFFHTKTDRPLRNFIIENCFIDGIVSLPPRTFYTTPKKTFILCITKKADNKLNQEYGVFNYIVTNVGESLDAVRSDESLADLNTLKSEFRKFSSDKKEYIPSDDISQIFIKDIEYYKSNDMWMSDKLIDDNIKKELGLKTEDRIVSFEDVKIDLIDIDQTISEILDGLDQLDSNLNLEEKFKYKKISLGDAQKFKFLTTTLGYRQKEYREISIAHDKGYPLYTAANGVVAFLDKNHRGKIVSNTSSKHVSVATDGDGTAGTNIILHDSPYFLNSSRLSIEILDDLILPEYLYYSIKDIKKKFGFGYTIKCNKDNLIEYFDFLVPVNDKDEICLEFQKEIVDNMKKREVLLASMSEIMSEFKEIDQFSKYLSISSI